VGKWAPGRDPGHGQALGEQVDDIAPGSLCVLWVVADAGDRGMVDRRVVEGVQGAAVDREAPVDARGLRFPLPARQLDTGTDGPGGSSHR